MNTPLGDLEQAVMRIIWYCGEPGCQGADVLRSLENEHPVAITTVLTTLDRLRDKGFVRREREGKAYRYWATLSEEQLQQRIVTGVLNRLIAQFPGAVATYFAQRDKAETADGNEAAVLANLGSRVETLSAAKQEEEGRHG